MYYKDQREKSGIPCSGALEENSAAPMLQLTHQHMTLKNTASYFRLTISGIIHRYFIGLGIVQEVTDQRSLRFFSRARIDPDSDY